MLTELQVTRSNARHAVHECSSGGPTHISTDEKVAGLCKSRQYNVFKIIFKKIIKYKVFLIFLMPWSMHILIELNLSEGYLKRYLQ